MLHDDLSGSPYSKAEHNRHLQQLIERGRGSIEFKHQNISAVLKGLGETWIEGQKPAFNFQMSLVDAVLRWTSARPEWSVRVPTLRPRHHMNDAKPLWIGPSPTQRNTPPPAELGQMMAIAHKFDVAGRDARNRAFGRVGEERILHHERLTLKMAGQDSLARKVKWVSEEDGNGAGHDIHSFASDGADQLIEVKTTNGWERTPFHISRNELAVADDAVNTGIWSGSGTSHEIQVPMKFALLRMPMLP